MGRLEPDPEKRPCDGCTACCQFLWVEEMDSPTGQPCIHQCEIGCAIFGKPERPPVCRGFYCLYAKGDPNIPYNPKDCGVMVWIDEGEVRFRELEYGALDRTWVDWAVDAFYGRSIVLEKLEAGGPIPT